MIYSDLFTGNTKAASSTTSVITLCHEGTHFDCRVLNTLIVIDNYCIVWLQNKTNHNLISKGVICGYSFSNTLNMQYVNRCGC